MTHLTVTLTTTTATTNTYTTTTNNQGLHSLPLTGIWENIQSNYANIAAMRTLRFDEPVVHLAPHGYIDTASGIQGSHNKINDMLKIVKQNFNRHEDNSLTERERHDALNHSVSLLQEILALDMSNLHERKEIINYCHFALGHAYLGQAEIEKAEENLLKVCEIGTSSSLSALGMERLGAAYFRLKNFHKASTSFVLGINNLQLSSPNVVVGSPNGLHSLLSQLYAELAITYLAENANYTAKSMNIKENDKSGSPLSSYREARSLQGMAAANYYLAMLSQTLKQRDKNSPVIAVPAPDNIFTNSGTITHFYLQDYRNGEYLVQQLLQSSHENHMQFRDSAFQIINDFKERML